MRTRETSVPGFDRLGDIDAANVVRCARTLLRRPLLHAASQDGDLLGMIYRHREVLRELFATLLGYRLVIRRRYARLYKSGPGRDATRAVPTLTPRGYAYVALTLAALTGCGKQVLLSRLIDDVRGAAVEAGITIDDEPGERRALATALRHLVVLGVLTETEGTVGPLAGDATAEALITVDTDLLGQLVTGPLSEADGPQRLVELASGDAGVHAATVEQAVRRRLVEDPVVHYRDLPESQANWLRRHRAGETRLLERYFGIVAESRSEGIATTDPQDYLNDTSFPGSSTVARVAQLAIPRLLDGSTAREGDHRHPVTREDFGRVCEELLERYPAAWSRRAIEDPESLVTMVVDLLRRVGVLIPHESGDPEWWLLSPSAHRWLPIPDGEPAPAERETEPPAETAVPDLALFDYPEGEPAR
ncbi:TIGR02678 family protein [Actinopolyspora lacussalsi subsp. righensis]|uniref:TIGR02678 family protein n=1 Tax=Actinopolyspora righensis TaxID=995060 RepID=A0A1I6YNW8_9ACTN|nr:TIGR02678 family protein [Actinopolyspora righensis]SFT52134.1 TIGR02678 family protein [Actinopolyspora righensis]